MEAEGVEGKTDPGRRRKSRLVVRLGAFLVSHSLLASFVCCAAGIITLLLLPVLAKNTYVSENALMPGSANPTFSSKDVLEATSFTKLILNSKTLGKARGIEIPRLIVQNMADVGAEGYYHKFQLPKSKFSPLHFFASNPNTAVTQNSSTCASFGVNSVGIIRAPRGDGKEAIVLVTPYSSENLDVNDALSLGLGFSIFSLLSRVTWLAKDIVWLAADSRYGEYTSVAAWLKDYHDPVFFGDTGEVDAKMCADTNGFDEEDSDILNGRNYDIFRRGGTMAAALVLKVMEKNEIDQRDSLTINAEASNGQMPNLDLINIVHYLAVHRQGFLVKVGTIRSLLKCEWLNLIGALLERLNNLAESFNPKWKFGIPTADFVEGTAILASSMYHQALGVPTGSHGAFRDYQVDAITLELSPRISLSNENAKSAFFLRGGRLIEGVVRSVNNLLEKFHQSFFLYLLTAPNKFVSVGVYMIAFALLAAPLPIVAAALFSGRDKLGASTNASYQDSSSNTKVEVVGSWKWLYAAKAVFMIHLWAVVVALLPYFISQFPYFTSSQSMIAWVALSVLALVGFYLILGSPYSYSRDAEWQLLKAVMIAASSTGLCLMSIINFSIAQVGALFLVPMCLMVQPLKKQLQSAPVLRLVGLIFSLVLTVVGFPLCVLLLFHSFSEEFGRVDIGIFWDWAEFLWTWNSATYLYLVLVHLPCWVLYMHVLLHP